MSSEARVLGPSFTDHVQELLERVDYRLAETAEEKQAIFRLRYQAYLSEGAIGPNRGELLTDHFDETDNGWVFGIYIDGHLASSIRVHVVSQERPISPSLEVFGDLLRPELALGRKLIDPTRFVADHEMARRHPELPYVTVRLGFVAGEHFDAEIGIASVRSEHRAFYRRLFGLGEACEPRLGGGWSNPSRS